MKVLNEQESFWHGEFGDGYTARNAESVDQSAALLMMSKMFARMERPRSLIEFGANIGLNLRAAKALFPDIQLTGIEINLSAYKQLVHALPDIAAFNVSILDFPPPPHTHTHIHTHQYDVALIKTVLIHISPEFLRDVYEKLYMASRRYIVIAEYYNPTPVEIIYRGHTGKLFKRDFAGELLDMYPDLYLLDYGFTYHRDSLLGHDDLNWFVLEKR